ncbi:MAG: S41 family peptidase [Candidatus Baltobacteraceae bacterium]
MSLFKCERAFSALLAVSIAFVASPSGRAAQAPAAPSPDERLFSLARLWGDVRYFDPWMAYRDIDWDAAALAAIPEVENASSSEAYRAAMQSMLATLHDPLTGVAPSPPPSPPPSSGDGLTLMFPNDRIAMLTIAPGILVTASDTQLETETAKIAAALASHQTVIIDLRPAIQESAEESSAVDSLLTATPVAAALVHGDLQLPTQRSRYYTGLRNQLRPDAEPFYTGGFIVDDASSVRGKAAAPHNVAFVVNANTVVPDLAVALVRDGEAVIFSDGPAPALLGGSVASLPLDDNLTAQFRTSEYSDLASAQTYAQPLPATQNPVSAAAAWLESHGPTTRRFDPAPPAKLANDMAAGRYYFPDEAHRVLAVFKIYNVIRYFFPYRNLMHDDWGAATLQAIANVRAARDERAYFQGIQRYYAHIHDGHGFVAGAPVGELFGGSVPWKSRYLHGQVVVTAAIDPLTCRDAGVRIGDVVTAVNGIPIQRALAAQRPFVNGSTTQSVELNLVNTLGTDVFSGPRGTTLTVTLRRPGSSVVHTARLTRTTGFIRHPRSGPIVRILPGNVGYVDLDRLEPSGVDPMFATLKNTRAIVFDDRGYPLGTGWAIAPRLSERKRFKGALFDQLVISNAEVENAEGALPAPSFSNFYQILDAVSGARYLKPVVVLVDERTISQAEGTALFFEAATHATFVGTPSAGANGDVTQFAVPGGIILAFSGLSVRHADGAQLQRVGIVPSVRVESSAADLAAGRDVVLEAGLQEALRRSGAAGAETAAALRQLRRLAATAFAIQVAAIARIAALQSSERENLGRSFPGASNTTALLPAVGSSFTLSSTDPIGAYKLTNASTDAALYRGRTVHVFGLLDTQAPSAAFWVRVDASSSTPNVDMMINHMPQPGKGLQPFSIVLPVPNDATRIYYGVWADGTGSISASHVQIETVSNEMPSTEGCTSSC